MPPQHLRNPALTSVRQSQRKREQQEMREVGWTRGKPRALHQRQEPTPKHQVGMEDTWEQSGGNLRDSSHSREAPPHLTFM